MRSKGDIFHNIDKLYNESNFHEDEKVLEILNEHLNIEKNFYPKNKNLAVQQFHSFNIETINFLFTNINNSCFKSDSILYLYSFMIYRYMTHANINQELSSKTLVKYRELYSKWIPVYNTANININNISSDLLKVFSSYILGNG